MVNGPFGNIGGNSAGNGMAKFAKSAHKMGPGAMMLDTYLNLRSGDDLGTAAFKAVGTGMLWSMAPGVMGAQMAGSLVSEAYMGYQTFNKQAGEKYKMNYYRGTVGGNYQDSQRALTMRQAAVQAIQGSKLNARSALGGEAKILNQNMHRVY